MLILLLDDDVDIRHKLVDKHLAKEHTIIHTFNVDAAINALLTSQDRIDIALLDHDLGDFVLEEDGSKYERHGVYFLYRMFNEVPEDKLPLQFILHSGNVVGVENMRHMLQNKKQTTTVARFSGQMLTDLANKIRP